MCCLQPWLQYVKLWQYEAGVSFIIKKAVMWLDLFIKLISGLLWINED